MLQRLAAAAIGQPPSPPLNIIVLRLINSEII